MKNNILASIGLAALTTVTAYAGTMGAQATYPMGFSVGGDIGYGYLSTQETYLKALNEVGSPDILTQHKGIGRFIWGAHAGYDTPVLERLLLGVEVGYKDMGRSSYSSYNYSPASVNKDLLSTTVRVEQQAVDFLLSSRLYVLNGLNLFGKAGAAYVRSNTSSNYSETFTTVGPFTTFISEDPTTWRIRPEFDLGVGYSFTHNLDLHVMYTYINGTDGDTNGLSRFYSFGQNSTVGTFGYNALSAGLSYYFG